MGAIADSSAAGTKTASAASARMPPVALPRNNSPAQRTTGSGTGPAGQPASGPGAVGARAERNTDHRTAGLQRDADVRSDQAQPDHLEHEHGGRRGEDGGH